MPDRDAEGCGSDSQYPIGYKKPPSHTRFQPGMSGNAQGRPKGSRNFSTVMAKELETKIDVTENGRRRRISKREAIVKQAVNKAAGGDLKATITVLNEARPYETSTQPVLGPGPLIAPEDQTVMANILERIRQSQPSVSSPESGSNSGTPERLIETADPNEGGI